jgi:Zn-dependent oligopeptidase
LWAFGEASAVFDFIVTIADNMSGVLGGAWHDAARAANEQAARFRSAICQRLDLYEAIRAVVPPGPVEERLRADLLRRFEHAGAHLDEPDRRRVTAINTRLADLASDFMANLRAADAASGVIAEDVAGLPDGLVAAARAAAAERGLAGYFVPYSEHNAAVVLAQAEDRTVREEMYRLTVACTAEANGPVVAEILALRQELAELLGYPDFVELHRASRMVADPQALLDELAAAYGPQADREHAELVAFAPVIHPRREAGVDRCGCGQPARRVLRHQAA